MSSSVERAASSSPGAAAAGHPLPAGCARDTLPQQGADATHDRQRPPLPPPSEPPVPHAQQEAQGVPPPPPPPQRRREGPQGAPATHCRRSGRVRTRLTA